MAISSILDPIMNPILALHPLFAIILISLVIAVVMTLVYKWMTDQTLMKTLKEDIKKFQKQMKELKSEPAKAMEVQKKAMQTNMKYMMQSMKPTLISFIPIILIFGWLNAHLAYEPLMPGNEFSVEAMFKEGVSGSVELKVPEGFSLLVNNSQDIIENKVEWSLKAPDSLKNPEGDMYTLEFKKGEDAIGKNVLITYKQRYENPIKNIRDSSFKMISVSHNTIKPLGEFSIFGWRPGWLGVYIICSIIFSMSLRKFLKLH